jgi:glutamate formiminotransferase/formiminotetrahydrofolate cyclodeaminase
VDEVASSAPTPGGGSVAALAGSLAAALATMVARLTIGKKRYAAHEARMREIERAGDVLRRELLELVTEDAKAYEGFVAAAKMSQRTPEEVATREKAQADAARNAAAVPLRTADACLRALELASAVAEVGNQNAVSDAGVAAWMARAGAEGAALNVAINLPSVAPADRDALESKARRVTERATVLHAEIMDQVRSRMGVAAGA